MFSGSVDARLISRVLAPRAPSPPPGGEGFCRLALAIVLLVLAGCATAAEVVQRATEGPTARDIWYSRFFRSYARLPTFDETSAWQDQLDQKVSDYFTQHPEIATSPRASQFRFHRRLSVGMSKEEVTLLAGPPDALTSDRSLMEAAAKQFWPEIGKGAREMWVYPAGWQLYFDGDRLVDLTVHGGPPID